MLRIVEHKFWDLRCGLAAAAALLAFTPPPGALAQTEDYAACLQSAEVDPAATRDRASRWARLGGGAPARHCAAIALIGLGADEMAARELTELGSAPGALPAADRASALILAGDLWMAVGAPEAARKAFRGAESLTPEDPRALIGVARVEAALQNLPGAVRLLGEALSLTPDNPEALTLRAAAQRRLGRPEAALTDARRATDLAPRAALAWFERGAAEFAAAAYAEAKDSWLRASALDPEGVAGEMARTNLQRLLLVE